MATFDFYAYFNVQEMAALFDGIAAISGSADYLDVFKLVAMLSFLVFIAGVAVGKGQEPFEFFKWLMIVVMIHSILLVPKADVVFIDRTGTSPPTVRSNIPIGLAFFGSVTSHVGDTITRMFEAVFALPDDLKFQRNGIMFGNTVLVDTLQVVPTNPTFRDDLVSFINNCTYYDIIAGRVSQDVFARTDDVWSMMSNTSNTLTTRISTDPTGSKTCSAAYADLNSRWAAETTQTMQTRGRVLNPQAINNVAAGALLDSQIGSSYSQLTNVAKSSTDMLRQNMTLNSVRDSQLVSAQRLDAPSSAIVGAAQAQAEMGMVTNYLTMARVAERAAPGIRNVIELICYGVFPLVVLLLIVAGEQAGKFLKAYVMSLVWVQLIPPLYAILNFVMTSTSRSQLAGIAESTTTTAAVNLVNIGQLAQKGLSESAIAGFLTLSLPVIAYALVKSGEIGASSLYGAAMSPAKSSAEGAANSIGAGNVSQGSLSQQASTVQEQWVHSSMDYTGYLADRLHQDGKLDAFNMLYQTNPDQAARMAATYLAETNFDAMPTPARVSTDLHDVQSHSPTLSGRTIGGESQRIGQPADKTGAVHQQQVGVVQSHGYQQKRVANNVQEKVDAAVDANMDAIGKQQSQIEPAIAAGKLEAGQQLQRSAQIPGMSGPASKPGAGSAAEQQDKVHSDLFGPNYKNKR